MRILIAGLGSVGRRHLRNLVALGERDVALYRTGKSTLPEEDLTGFPVDHDLDSALGRRPDAVIVANPTAVHLDVAIPAARAGCHLLIEKPVSDSMKRIEELEHAVEASGSRVLVGYQYRFHPGLRRVAEWIHSGAIGRVVTAAADYGEFLPAWHPWEDHRAGYSARADLGGGAILTLSHAVDNLLWILGPARLAASRTEVVPEIAADVESAATLHLDFDNGGSAITRMDYLRSPKVHRLDVVGTTGSIDWDEASGAATLRRSGSSQEEISPPPAGYDRNDMFLAELSHFMRVVRGEEESICGLRDGVKTLEILLRAREMGAGAAMRRADDKPEVGG